MYPRARHSGPLLRLSITSVLIVSVMSGIPKTSDTNIRMAEALTEAPQPYSEEPIETLKPLASRGNSETIAREHIFDTEIIGTLGPVETPTSTPTPEPTPAPYYSLTEKENKALLKQIAIEGDHSTQRLRNLVAQAILDRTELCLCSDGTVLGTLYAPRQFSYRGNYEITDGCQEAIDSLFTKGERVTEERIVWFCNPEYISKKTFAWFQTYELVTVEDGCYFFGPDKKEEISK